MKKFLGNRLFLVILVYIISFIFVNFSISTIHAYRDYEKFSLFIDAKDMKNDDMVSYLENETKQCGIEEFSYYCYPKSLTSDNSLQTSVYQKAANDIVIINENELKDMGEAIQQHFVPIEQFLDESSKDYYVFNDQKYGLKIYDVQNETYSNEMGFANFVNYEEYLSNSYLCIRSSSVHFGAKTNHGITILQNLIKWVKDNGR